MSSEALTSSTEDKEEEWLWGCTAERGLEEKETRNKTEWGATAADQSTQSQPAPVAFHMKMLCKLLNYCNKHTLILCVNRIRWSMDTLWEHVIKTEAAGLYRQVALAVSWVVGNRRNLQPHIRKKQNRENIENRQYKKCVGHLVGKSVSTNGGVGVSRRNQSKSRYSDLLWLALRETE